MVTIITIRSGTRDELGGVEVGLVNIYERAERPGRLSVELVLEDGGIILAAGDEVTLGGRMFRLLELVGDRGAYLVRFETVEPVPSPLPAMHGLEIPSVSAEHLRGILRGLSPAIMQHLAGERDAPELLGWTHESKQATHKEWNGGDIGPNSSHLDRAQFASGSGITVEANIVLEEIRFDPAEIYRREVSAFWRVNDAKAHIFLRAEGEAKLDCIVGDRLDPQILALIRGAIGDAGR